MKIYIHLLLCVLLHQSLFQTGLSYNIVFYHSMATSSHRTAIWPLAERLADLGHNVTYIFPMENEKRQGSHPKIEEIAPSKMIKIIRELVGDFDINIKLENRLEEWLQEAFSKGVDLCEAFYDSPETQEWLSRPDLKIDLFVIDASFGECAFGLVHKFQAKHIFYSPIICPLVYEDFGVIPETSSIPDFLLPYVPRQMSFLARVWNTIMPLLFRVNILQFRNKVEPVIREKTNAIDMPPLWEFVRNTSLVFHNNYFIEAHAEALPPQFISMSGLWCNLHPVKALPKKHTDFLKDDDFVYVSLGSAVDVGKMSAQLRNKFFHAFRAFPNLKFFWRWNGPIPDDKPDNAFLAPWFPQQDVLGHAKIKAFITQAGRPSSQEALCAGVPLIAMPIFVDQNNNANRLEMNGAAIQLDIMSLTGDDISNAIQEVVFNPKYKEATLTLSKMFKDRPVNPLDNLVYWTEYALRYDTSIMRSLGMEQTWYERRLLDVYGFIALVLLASVGLLYRYSGEYDDSASAYYIGEFCDCKAPVKLSRILHRKSHLNK